MTRPRLGLLGLCAVMFGLMAFSTGAQATVGAHWWILNSAGTVKTDAGSLEAEVELEKDSATLTVHAELFGHTQLLILCKTIRSVNMIIKALASIKPGAVIKLGACVVELNGAESPACQPKDAVGGAGTILTKALHGLIVLHELAGGTKDEVVLLSPDVGETLATIEMGAECAIGTKINIIGPHFVIKDCENLIKSHLVKHLFEEAPLTELWVISKTEEHKVSILGSWWSSLIGVLSGLRWAGEAA